MRAVVTGGGTGGHIYPALAVADGLRRAGDEVLYIGGTSGPEAEIVPSAGVPFRAVTARKLRKLASPSTPLVFLALWRGFRQAGAILRAFRPDAVVSTGGYVAAGTALAAALGKLPTIVMACDAVPGRTNLWLARWATRLCIWFDETAGRLPSQKCVAAGVPIRPGIAHSCNSDAARRALGLSPGVFTIFVYGGSQGARRLNELLVGALPYLSGHVQVLHQTGKANVADVSAAVGALDLQDGISHYPRAYLEGDALPQAYAAADLVICRCGIVTLAEVTANGLPTLMVPLPTAYADHQTANARAVARRGAGIVLPQPTLTPESLAGEVESLRSYTDRRAAMAESARALGRPEAAAAYVQLAHELAARKVQ